ncbi:effector binding domain-containing protein [Clostridium hydrogenum]|uniref:effector binding domain-containing protein n=1 Tax=Clostridium hydrogenum TaxID=2855764 RepID=UPI002E31BAE8|nr:effector binding domain-containing protein [Clostridium hydrogenum]
MKLETISEVSKKFSVSTRTLRYYEKIGLMESVKKDGYAYRTYDESAIIRLQQIIVLRKLRIPLKEISLILESERASTAVEIFQNKLNEISNEVSSLSTIKLVLEELSAHLRENSGVEVSKRIMNNEEILKIVDSLTVTKINFKEDVSMNDLNHADEKLSKLKDARIVYLPPATVAAVGNVGGCPSSEDITAEEVNKFIKNTGLAKLKPDFRHYGFNHPSGGQHGYERWITIPDDMEVKEPFIKKKFEGGLYAAHTIRMGNFDEWQLINDWVENNDEYEKNFVANSKDGDECLEEHLNYINLYDKTSEELTKMQLDLLIPIKPKYKV